MWGALAVLAVSLVAAAPASASPYIAPGISPPGANDWNCRPTAARPVPVVLVHGTFADMTVSWNLISPALKASGYCVFALDYGRRGTGPIEDSAAELDAFVARVLAATGAARVSLVGHSQGGMMPRWYLKFRGGTAEVDALIGLSPSNHGTSNPGALLAEGVPACVSCGQQRTGSALLTPQRRGRDARRRVVHGRPDPLRRGRDPLLVGLPGGRAEHHERAPAGALPARHLRAPRDHLQPGCAALDQERPGPPGAGGPGLQAELPLRGQTP
jgi:pimeloyl-ACP methyl ester carboxylesterase